MSRWFAGLGVALRSIIRRRRLDEECRDPWSGTLGGVRGDLRHAARTLRRNPAFFGLAISIMALGIGANSAVFSIVNAVLLKPLPFAGAERIVTLSTFEEVTGEVNPLVVIANLRDWRDQSLSFEAMATYAGGDVGVSTGSGAEFVRSAIVDRDFFRVFAVQPVIGRTFVAEEMVPGGQAVLISHAYWQSRFGGDRDVLQRRLRAGGDDLPIRGVLPPGFRFPGETSIWIADTAPANSRTRHNRFAVGRLEPNVSLAQAQAELTTIAARLGQQYPESNKGRSVAIARLQDQLVSSVRVTLYLLWGVVGVVLLIACANTATLLLGKATARSREIAVRTAFGASRPRIIRQLVAESLVLAILAAAAGMLLAHPAAAVLARLAPFEVVRSAGIGVDRMALAFTLAVSLATSMLFGLVPALHTARIDAPALELGGTRSVVGGRTGRTRGILVVAEIALAVVLLTGAGLLMKSLVALHRVELGFRPENVLVMKATGARAIRENNAFFTDVMGRVAAMPDVVAVGATSIPPGDLSNAGSGAYFIDGRPEHRDRPTEMQALFTVVAPGTFAALGIPLKMGRDFNESDIFDRPLVAIVNESLVRRSFGGENPIGRTIFCSFDRPNDGMTIVGVVGDVRQRDPAMQPMAECYMPYRQHAYNNNTLHVVIRTVGDPAALAATVRRIGAQVSPDVPVSFTTMDALVSQRMDGPRFRALLFAIFAGLAVCLAAAGVHGVMAYTTAQRSQEFALRMALGASPRSVLQLVLRQALLLAAAGAVIGVAAAAAVTRVLATTLFEVQPLDMQVYVGVVLLLGVIAVAAAYVPARRATIISPAEALNAE